MMAERLLGSDLIGGFREAALPVNCQDALYSEELPGTYCLRNMFKEQRFKKLGVFNGVPDAGSFELKIPDYVSLKI